MEVADRAQACANLMRSERLEAEAGHEPSRLGRYLKDYEGRLIRLTPERLAHIMTHPEMVSMEAALEETLAAPELVVESARAPDVQLSYRRYSQTRVSDKLLCVVVKTAGPEAFVITAYLTDRVKRGRRVWTKGV